MINNTNQGAMPLLVIEAEGKIITSNFAEFDQAARHWLAEINRNLRTDEEFDQATKDAKKAKEVEDLLAEAREAVLGKAETLNAELSRLSGLSSVMRDARLELTKQIEKAKEDRREQLIEAEMTKLNCDKSMRETFRESIETAIKGRKNLQSMREAARIARTVANDQIGRCKVMLDEFASKNCETLLPDRRNLEVCDPVVLLGELRRRSEAAAAQAEAKRLREEADKARAEAAAAKAQAAAQAKAEPEKAEPEKAEPEKAEHGTDSAPQRAETQPQPAADDKWLPDTDDAPPSSIPADNDSAGAEWDEFFEAVEGAFATLKPSRAKLKDPTNIERAKRFALAVNSAWEDANQ